MFVGIFFSPLGVGRVLETILRYMMPRDIMSSEPRHWMVFGQLVMAVQCCAEGRRRRCLSTALHSHEQLAKYHLSLVSTVMIKIPSLLNRCFPNIKEIAPSIPQSYLMGVPVSLCHFLAVSSFCHRLLRSLGLSFSCQERDSRAVLL